MGHIRRRLCAVSSVVEHYVHTVGVIGSNPIPRTISSNFFVFRPKNPVGTESAKADSIMLIFVCAIGLFVGLGLFSYTFLKEHS